MTWKVPHYVTLGFSLLLRSEDTGIIKSIALSVDELPDGGIPEAIEEMVKQFATRGIRPLTAEEYAEFCADVAAQRQADRLYDAMNAHAQGRALSDGEADAILRAHKGVAQ